MWFTVGLNQKRPVDVLLTINNDSSEFDLFRDTRFDLIAQNDDEISTTDLWDAWGTGNAHFDCEPYTLSEI